uniref:Uncharacterized protein n=1 Tax=Dicentrarchus labrax TaxID=13489 RepID=A0A8P4KIV0_DICLA
MAPLKPSDVCLLYSMYGLKLSACVMGVSGEIWSSSTALTLPQLQSNGFESSGKIKLCHISIKPLQGEVIDAALDMAHFEVNSNTLHVA